MASVRSYRNWNKRTDQKTEKIKYEVRKKYENKMKIKFSKWVTLIMTNRIVQIILLIIIALAFLLFPVNNISNEIIKVVLVGIRIVVISGLVISQVKNNPIASLAAILLIGTGITIWSNNISQDILLEMIMGEKWEYQYMILICICCMISVWVCLAFWGVKKYSYKRKRDKIKFVVCVGVEYIIILVSVIGVYANLYMAYHDKIYWEYQKYLFVTEGESVLPYGKRIEKKINGYDWVIYGKYGEKDENKLCPIYITIYDETGRVGIIEPDLNIVLDEKNIGTTDNEMYMYFSFVSFFSSGYGDIYPTSTITRKWAVQEMIISHILMVLLIPVLITSVQEFIRKS